MPRKLGGTGRVHPPPDDGGGDALHDGELGELESQIASAAERALALELRAVRRSRRRGRWRAARDRRRRGRARRARRRRCARRARRAKAAGPGRQVDDGAGFEIRGGRHPDGRGGARRQAAASSPTIAVLRRRPHLARHRPQHGRQEHLSAAERADRDPGADRLLRAGRRGAHRRGRPAVQPGRRRRRSGARPLDLHGRDGRDRGNPEPGRAAKSFVILDEIGRGTATFDGLSIAWAALEHLHEVNRCRALFATHYHELTALAAKLPALACHTMRVKEWKGDVVFLHEVAPGTADRSYGIHVAKLAGLPAAVTARAEEILAILEKGEQGGALARLADDLPLFQRGTARSIPIGRAVKLRGRDGVARHPPRRTHPPRGVGAALPVEGSAGKIGLAQ